MKNTTPTWFGVMLIASAGLVYCGGEDSPLTTPSGSGGGGTRSTTSGPTTVTGGTATTTAGTGAGGGAATTVATTTATTTTTGGTGAGGAGGVGAGSGGTGGAATGGAGGGVVDVCPAAQPAPFAACTSDGQVCDYPGFACTCMNGMGRDGGMRLAWNCMRAGFDGGMCPANPPVTGGFCMNAGNVCVYPNETCTCQAGAMGARWNCI